MLSPDTLLNDRYRVIEPVGEGGMATVYRAVDTKLGRTVAVKVLHPEYARDQPFLQRFQQEAEFAASLGAHPNIVDIYDIGQDDNLRYIVMEYIEGHTLKDLIQQKRRFEVPEAFSIGQQVASALDFAHKRGLVHRDVKPQNILVTPEGQAKVTDFGIARSVSTSQLTRTGMVIGTVHYFSPEQAQGKPLGPPTDIYSLGIITYEMLTGHLPFDAENAIGVAMQHIHSEPPNPWDFAPELPARAVATVMRALAKDPEDRYRDAAEFAAALGSQAGPPPSGTTVVAPLTVAPRPQTAVYQPVTVPPVPPARPVAAAQPPSSRGSRTVWLALLAALLIAAIAAGTFFAASNLLGGAATPTGTPRPTAKPTPRVRKKPTKTAVPTIPVVVPRVTSTFPPPTSTSPPATVRPTTRPTARPRPTATSPQPTPIITPIGPVATGTSVG